MLGRVLVFCLLSLALGHEVLEQDELPSDEPGMKPGKFPMGEYPESGPDPYYNQTRPFLDVLPAKYRPGEIVDSVTQKELNRALDDVIRAGKLMHDRGCAIGIANEAGNALENPRFWLYSGMSFAAPPPDVETGKSSLLLFVKKDWQATGTVGVVTYDIVDTDYKVAVMWSVPFDFNIWDVWYNIKVYPKSYATGEHMYNQMYYYAGPWRPSGWDEREEYGVKLRASMTKNIQAKLMLWVDDTGLDPEGTKEIYKDCSYHGTWVGNYCWRECHSGGYCWVNKKCGKYSDCQGETPCYENCKKKP